MSNVIQLRPRDVVSLRPEPEPRTQTARQLFDDGVFPSRGDFVFVATLHVDEDDSKVVITVPGSGRVRESIIVPDKGLITLRFDFGLTITISGQSALRWYPAKEATA